MVDPTGLKIFGEGERKVRQRGAGKRRAWRKIYLAVDATAKDIIGIEVTTANWYDKEGAHVAIAAREVKATIPPREGAAFGGGGHPRDVILAEVATKGREGWKDESGYHQCNLAGSHVRTVVVNQLTPTSVLGFSFQPPTWPAASSTLRMALQ